MLSHNFAEAQVFRLGSITDRITADGSTLYGVCDSGVYQVDVRTGTWAQVAPVVPRTATSLAVDGDMLYIGTKQSGVLRFQRNDP